MDKILLMIQLQAQLNESTNGEDWVKGVTKNGKTINWRRCIYMECAEMVDSFGWKHWKSINQEPDWDNLQIEVIDVWHFIISLAIEEYAKQMRGNIDDLALDISQLPIFDSIIAPNDKFAKQDDVIAKVEDIIRLSLEDEIDLTKLLASFFDLVL